MATTNPPLLPISTTTPASQTPSTTDPATTPGLRFFLSRFSDSIRRSLSDRRPWSELIDRSAFSRPDSLSDATSRVRKNLGYFRVNYAAVIALCLAASLLSHPFSLVVLLALLAAWCFLYLLRPSDPPLVLFGRTFSDRETLLGLVVVTFLTVFLTSVGSLIISALLIGSALVCLHGAFRMPEDLFLDEVDSVTGGAAGGLLSFLGGAGSTGLSQGDVDQPVPTSGTQGVPDPLVTVSFPLHFPLQFPHNLALLAGSLSVKFNRVAWNSN